MKNFELSNTAHVKQENTLSKLQIINAVTSTLINNAGEKPEEKEEMAITFWTEITNSLKGDDNTTEIKKLCALKNIQMENLYQNIAPIWITTRKFLINPTERIEVIRELMHALAKNPIHEIDSNGFIEMLKSSLNQTFEEQKIMLKELEVEEVEKAKKDIGEGFINMFEFVLESEEFKDALNDISFIFRAILLPEVNRSQIAYKSPLVQNIFKSIEEDIRQSTLHLSDIGGIMADSLDEYSNTKLSSFSDKQAMKRIKTEIQLMVSTVSN
jgi:hypothetical protein